MNKLLLASSIFLGFSSTTMASPCDSMALIITGPTQYQYTINVVEGTLNKKGNAGDTSVSEQLTNSQGANYKVFSGVGTRGGIRGSVLITSPDMSSSVTVPFRYYSNGKCYVLPNMSYADAGNFIVLVEGVTNHYLDLKIKEFK